MKYIKPFSELTIKDIPLVGGKNASLGELIRTFTGQGIAIPTGFAITAPAYWHYVDYNNLRDSMRELLSELTPDSEVVEIQRVGEAIREILKNGQIPPELEKEIREAYKNLSSEYRVSEVDVAVRSSATAEDLPGASFAGQQETFLNVQGIELLLQSCKKSFASLFTDRAIVYRRQMGFDHFQVALSIGVQKMIRSDKASAGVAFSIDTESGSKNVIVINGSWGLGDTVVQGLVTPDEYILHKPTLKAGFKPLVKKKRGSKEIKRIYAQKAEQMVEDVPTDSDERALFVLSDQEIFSLGTMVLAIEEHYSKQAGSLTPMDIEWAKDGNDGRMYIVQARPETVHAGAAKNAVLVRYTLAPDAKKKAEEALLAQGVSVGQKIASGVVRVIRDVSDIESVQTGDIIVTIMTDPDWVPALKKSAALITQQGGRTCHAAIVSRELGIPALIGVENALEVLTTGMNITIDCSQGTRGFVYEGILPVERQEIPLDSIPELSARIMVNLADPDNALEVANLPVSGVGLARIEFIVSNTIKVHPLALLYPDKTDDQVRAHIQSLIRGYASAQEFFIENLSQGIGLIAAAFYPRPVIVRLSDFKSNEYRSLIGGSFFEPIEENPMIGFRGASRYYHPLFKEAFSMECAALKKVREVMGLTNVEIMVPFVRTVAEAEKTVKLMEEHGLKRDKNLKIIMMCEIPSNVILIDEFLRYFDGISIGSNDLTQLVLGLDRDSPLLTNLFDERDEAVKRMMSIAITGAKKAGKYSGICGQAPSDYPEIAEFLMQQGIDSISLNSDSVVSFLKRYTQ